MDCKIAEIEAVAASLAEPRSVFRDMQPDWF